MKTATGILLLALLATIAGPATACTSFCMDTPDGPLYATNLDLYQPSNGIVVVNRRGVAKEGYFTGLDGDVVRWTSRHGSLTLNLAGCELVWGGMNEQGLVISSMFLEASECPDPDERPPLGEGFMLQHVLDTCATTVEAVAAFRKVRPVQKECFSHFLVADARGGAAAFEYLDGELVVHADEDAPLKAMANMRYQRSCQAYERGGPRWWWSNPGRSAQRVARAVDRARAYDAAVDTCAVTHAFTTLIHYVAAPHTRWNVVFHQGAREMWFRSDRSPAVKHVSLASFDFSCDAPLLMLDINAELEGDVDGEFRPYDHDVNLELFETFCAGWGIEVAHESALELMRLFESFGCAADPSKVRGPARP